MGVTGTACKPRASASVPTAKEGDWVGYHVTVCGGCLLPVQLPGTG